MHVHCVVEKHDSLHPSVTFSTFFKNNRLSVLKAIQEYLLGILFIHSLYSYMYVTVTTFQMIIKLNIYYFVVNTTLLNRRVITYTHFKRHKEKHLFYKKKKNVINTVDSMGFDE